MNISRVDPQVALVTQGERSRRRDGTDAELDRGAVRNEVRDVLADPPLHIADGPDRVLVWRDVDLDCEIDVADVDEAVAEGPRHRAVELDDDRPRGADRGVHRLDGRAERAESVRIGRGGIHEDGVERQPPAIEQARHVRQEDRDVVGPTVVDGLPRVRPDEQGTVAKMRRHLGGQVRSRPLAMQVDDAHVGQVRSPCDQRIEQHRRCRRRALEVDLLAGRDAGDGLGRRDDAHRRSVGGTGRAPPV